MNIHERIGEKVELAGVYAQDGAFITAGRLLREAAVICEEHQKAVTARLQKFLEDGE